ncbi:MAG: phage terminase small subunit P27 family [Halarsenatibacteraceae bacterium]
MTDKPISLELVKNEKKEKAKKKNKREMPKKPRGVLLKEARQVWNDIAPILFDMGALDSIDYPTFAIMLEHYALAIRAAETIREEGLFRFDENGVQRKHPATQVLRDNSQQYRQYLKEFGLSPKAREALNLDHYFDNKEYDVDDILNGEFNDL